MKDDQRVTLTKRLLKEGLFRLLETTDLDKISITKLCIESGINRATFYRHYEQPRDILNEARRELFLGVRNLKPEGKSENRMLKWMENTCSYFLENSDLMNILFKYRTDDEFVVFLNDLYKEQFPELRNKGYFKEVDEDMLRLGMYYFAGGIYYILRQWITEPIDKTPKEVALLIHHFLNITSD